MSRRQIFLAKLGAIVFRECGATCVYTTDKDAVRFEALGPLPFPIFRVPLLVEFDPPDVMFESVRAVLA